ncbi:endoplasmic reticulum-Golgi intermediate compartment protein 3-like isoform X2 [Littorina saxatilis]|uniref:endoplasmic reticulum-Golgi intermediate compartment protein 3-like isoform X2 n=1 Tax=Littorina saxatilis TaxID=31220 RepID=UPI0038B569CB
MQIRDVYDRLRQFDAYPKTLEDFRVKTFGGAIVTLVAAVLMVVLFVSELNYYLTKEVHPELFVDTSRGQKLRINIDITFAHLPCGYLSIDAMDVSGEQQIDVDTNLLKQRLDASGEPLSESPQEEKLVTNKPAEEEKKEEKEETKEVLDPNRCESCYGAENDEKKCCNNCEDVREAYRKKGWAFNDPESIAQCKREGWSEKMQAQKNEGCRAYGYLEVNKVAGNFHFAPGKSFQQHHVHVHDLQAFGGQKFNISHHINHLSFGTDYPGIVNPLDAMHEPATQLQMMYQYFVKIVPTTYTNLNKETVYTNQFSVTKHSKNAAGSMGEGGLPGVFFIYELSPMMVKYTETRRSFMHFLTGICAIIGGIFTVAGLIDSLIYHSANVIQKKIDLGKAS